MIILNIKTINLKKLNPSYI